MAYLAFFFLFFVWPLFGVLTLHLLLPATTKKAFRLKLLAGFGLGPFLLTWLFGIILYVFPRQSADFYGFPIWFLNLLALIIVFRRHTVLFAYFNAFKINISRKAEWIYVAVIAAGALVAISGYFIPLDQNDPMEYVQVARKFLSNFDLRMYPYLDSALTGGLIFPSTHLPGFPLGLALGMFLQGDYYNIGISHFYSIFYFILLVVSPFCFVGLNQYRSLMAAVIIITSPFFSYLARISHVDMSRIFFLTIGVLLAQYYYRKNNLRWGLVSILFGFASYFYHTLGLIAIMLIGMAFVFNLFRTFKSTVYVGVLGLILGTLLVSPFAWFSYQQTHSLFADNSLNPILRDNLVGANTFFYYARGFTSFQSIFFKGLLQYFVQSNIYGTVALMLPIIFLFYVGLGFGELRKLWLKIKHVIFVSYPFWIFFFLSAAFFCAGSYELLKNVRYTLSIFVFFSVFLSMVITSFFSNEKVPDALISSRVLYASVLFIPYDFGMYLNWTYPYLGMRSSIFRFIKQEAFEILFVLALIVLQLVYEYSIVQKLRKKIYESANSRRFFMFILFAPVIMSPADNFYYLKRWAASLNSVYQSADLKAYYSKIRAFELIMRFESNSDDKTVMTWRQADFGYLSGKKFMNHFDPKLVPVYLGASEQAVLESLENLNVKYLHFPVANFSATFTNSKIASLAGTPKFAILVEMDSAGNRIYELGHFPDRYFSDSPVAELTSKDWVDYYSGDQMVFPMIFEENFFGLPKKQILFSGGIGPFVKGAEYVFRIKVRGNGMQRFSVRRFKNSLRAETIVWQDLLEQGADKEISFLYKHTMDEDHLEMLVRPLTPGELTVEGLRVFKVENKR